MNTILYKAAPVGELIDADEKAGIIKGYGSVLSETKILIQ